MRRHASGSIIVTTVPGGEKLRLTKLPSLFRWLPVVLATAVWPIALAQSNPPTHAGMSVISGDTISDPELKPGQFQFRVSGAPGERFAIQTSTNLTSWTAIATNSVPPVGYYDFFDVQARRLPQHYYRTVFLPAAENLLESFRQDRILVKPKAGITLFSLGQLHASTGAQVLRRYPAIGNLQVLQVPSTASVSDLIGTYKHSALVEYAEPDFQVGALLAPNDFRYTDGSLWGLHNTGQLGGVPGADIHAPDAWDIQNAASTIIVAVIDTVVRYTHEDLADNMWVNPGEIPGNGIDDDRDGFVDDVHGINTIANGGDAMDDHGHGTHVSGTIGALGNNSVGVVGVAWKVQIMACKFLDPAGNGFISDAIRCM